MIVYSLTKKELSKKINDKDFWLKSRLPITPYRLYSQINSPLADDRDICLIIALDSQNEIKGFIGILPDSIFIDNNRKKIGVLSSWWVDKTAQGVGGLLLHKAIKDFNGSILAMHYSKQAGDIYKKSGLFVPLKHQDGKLFFNKIDLYVKLLNKYRWTVYFSLFTKLVEKIINTFYKFRIFIWKINNKQFDNFEYTSFVNDEITDFINKNSNYELFYKNKKIFNWKLNYRWVIAAPLKDRLSPRYRFSSVLNNFDFFPIKLYNKNELISFAIIRIRNNRITVPYFYYKEDGIKDFANLLCYHMILLKADSLELYNQELIKQIQNSNFPFIYKKMIKKEIMIGKKYSNYDFDECEIQLGDGEGIYTY